MERPLIGTKHNNVRISKFGPNVQSQRNIYSNKTNEGGQNGDNFSFVDKNGIV